MAALSIILDPETQGLGDEFARAHLDGTLIHLGDDAELTVSGLTGGMTSGAPSMMLGFVLPDGRCVIAETSWRLFAAAFWAFAAKFGTEKPDASGMALEYDATGAGARIHLDLVPDDAPNRFQCELCGAKREEPAGEEGAIAIVQWVHRHFREKHPDWLAPEPQEGSGQALPEPWDGSGR